MSSKQHISTSNRIGGACTGVCVLSKIRFLLLCQNMRRFIDISLIPSAVEATLAIILLIHCESAALFLSVSFTLNNPTPSLYRLRILQATIIGPFFLSLWISSALIFLAHHFQRRSHSTSPSCPRDQIRCRWSKDKRAGPPCPSNGAKSYSPDDRVCNYVFACNVWLTDFEQVPHASCACLFLCCAWE